jgi:hypothetical protein
MSENQQNTMVLPAQPDKDIDWFLRFLVQTVNGTETFYTITLNVGGLLVSGELIGGHKYFEGISDELKKAGLDNEGAGLIKSLGDHYIKEREQEQESDSKIFKPPVYIHLRNARIFHPGGTLIPTNRSIWWRGRLNAIDGFSLGILSDG